MKRDISFIKGVVMEAQCLICHGDPSYAPRSLVKIYGKDHGFTARSATCGGGIGCRTRGRNVLSDYPNRLFNIHPGSLGDGCHFSDLDYFHYMVLVKPLRKASSFFKSIVSGEKGLEMKLDVKGDDEISEVVGSFIR